MKRKLEMSYKRNKLQTFVAMGVDSSKNELSEVDVKFKILDHQLENMELYVQGGHGLSQIEELEVRRQHLFVLYDEIQDIELIEMSSMKYHNLNNRYFSAVAAINLEIDSIKKKRNAESFSTYCPACKCDHTILKCPTYWKLNYMKRYEIVLRGKLCFNCLGSKHFVKHCDSVQKCGICHEPHHTTIHRIFEEISD